MDDVYINCDAKGENAIYNGDFEWRLYIKEGDVKHHVLANLHAQGWSEFSEGQNPALYPMIPNVDCNLRVGSGNSTVNTAYNPTDTWTLGTDEVRSGSWAYKGQIKPIPQKYNNPAPYYNAPFIYKTIQQYFECGAMPDRLSAWLDVYPSPANGETPVSIAARQGFKDEKTMELYNAQGLLMLKAQFIGDTYSFTNKLKPGIYIVRVSDKEKSSEKKLVITY